MPPKAAGYLIMTAIIIAVWIAIAIYKRRKAILDASSKAAIEAVARTAIAAQDRRNKIAARRRRIRNQVRSRMNQIRDRRL